MTIHIGADPGDIAETVLMPGDPYRARWAAETFLENAVCVNQVRGMLGFTGTYISASTEDDQFCSAFGLDVERLDRQRGVGDVVDDADGEAVLRLRCIDVVEHGLDHRWGEVLRAEAVPAADDEDIADQELDSSA